MTTISLTDVTVSSDYASRAEGWIHVQFSNGQTIRAYCPDSSDNWALGTKRLCQSDPSNNAEPIKVDKLLLQATQEGKYLVLKAELPKGSIPMTYARPADEHVYMELAHKQQNVFSADFLSLAALIFIALYGLKWLFEKYLLPRL